LLSFCNYPIIRFICHSSFRGAVQSAQNQKIENFPIYNVNNERHTLFQNLYQLNKDEYLILNFTSINCKPCKKEISELVKLEIENRNVVVCYIYSETDKNKVKRNALVRTIPEDKLVNVYTDMFGTIKKELNIKVVPYTILINKEKNILLSLSGYSMENIQIIKNFIKN
jgi:thiol-disulfide isomerase/thioredoxin